MEANPSNPPPFPTHAQRYKLIWRLLLISNLGLGAYMFVKAKQRDAGTEGRNKAKVTSSPVTSSTSLPPEESMIIPTTIKPMRCLEPIPEDQQRELFKWMVEEKRKAMPKDREEKKRIDEEKGILKQFIRQESIPKF